MKSAAMAVAGRYDTDQRDVRSDNDRFLAGDNMFSPHKPLCRYTTLRASAWSLVPVHSLVAVRGLRRFSMRTQHGPGDDDLPSRNPDVYPQDFPSPGRKQAAISCTVSCGVVCCMAAFNSSVPALSTHLQIHGTPTDTDPTWTHLHHLPTSRCRTTFRPCPIPPATPTSSPRSLARRTE